MKKKYFINAFLMLFLTSFLAFPSNDSQEEKSWQWSLEKIKSKVAKVRAWLLPSLLILMQRQML
jgi:hypothetical protein